MNYFLRMSIHMSRASSLCVVVVQILLVCVAVPHAELTQELQSGVNFRGMNSTFHCKGRGRMFWHVDDVLFSFISLRTFSKMGFMFDTTYLEDGKVSSTMTVQSSLSRNNNNTVLRCTVVGPDANVSISTATLTIIDMSQVELFLPEDDLSSFLLKWDQVYVPSKHFVTSYAINVMDTSGKLLKSDRVDAIPLKDVYKYIYKSQQSRLELPACSRIIFSVVAVTSIGSSQSVTASWEKTKNLKMLTGVQCTSLMNSVSALVRFDNPEVCVFQNGSYTITIFLLDQPIGSVRSLITTTRDKHGPVDVDVKLAMSVDLLQMYSVLVDVEVGEQRETKKASCTVVQNSLEAVGKLKTQDSGDLTGGQIAILTVVVFISFALCIGNVITVIYVFRASKM